MRTVNWHYDFNPNVGNFDRALRYAVGASLISVLLLFAPESVGWVVLLALLGIPIVISAIIGWDPVYALFQKHANPLYLPRSIASIGKRASRQSSVERTAKAA